MRRLLVLAALVAAFVFLVPVIARAHEWYSGTHDPVTGGGCCGGHDCAALELEPGMLTGEAEGYRLRLTLEQARRINPQRFEPLDVLIPWGRIQPSPDGNFHLCIPARRASWMPADLYCFFAPPNT